MHLKKKKKKIIGFVKPQCAEPKAKCSENKVKNVRFFFFFVYVKKIIKINSF